MDEYLKSNKEHWNEITPYHERSEFYDVEGFKNGRCTLHSIERDEVGDVTGKSLLHLQCHFGLDTLSWARRGAKGTGVDFSEEAIETAQRLGEETGIRADFICSDIYALPEILNKNFDIVFSSWGILSWIPDLKRWAEVIAHFLKPCGFFYIAEIHPFLCVFDDAVDCTELRVRYPYFHNPEPMKFEGESDYADSNATVTTPTYQWSYPLGKVVTSLISAGLHIEYLHEFPRCCYQALPFMTEDEQGWWRLEGDKIPLTFSIKATKP